MQKPYIKLASNLVVVCACKHCGARSAQHTERESVTVCGCVCVCTCFVCVCVSTLHKETLRLVERFNGKLSAGNVCLLVGCVLCTAAVHWRFHRKIVNEEVKGEKGEDNKEMQE